ncbi:TolC family protein [Candidatus Marinimicrobia bacterium MT.SAG.3]|nr:TolC family protein [Candidatus Marinimicrobia bacterium MT.SAG.3]
MKFKEVKPVFRIPTLILLFALMSNSTGANAQESEISQTVTLTEFLNQLKTEHPLFTKEDLTSEIFRSRQQSLAGAQDWNLVSSLGYFSEEPVISFASPSKTSGTSFSGGLEKTFWGTGGRLSTTITTTSLKFALPMGFDAIPSDNYQSEMALTYIHPLMKNRKGFLDRLQYNLMQFDINASEINALENEENFLTESANKFLNWVFLVEQRNIIEERLKLSKTELERTERKRRANLVEKVDLIRAGDAVRIAEQNLFLSESRLKGLVAELAVLTQQDDYHSRTPQYELYKTESLPPLEEVRANIESDSRIVRMLNIRIQQLNLVRRGFKETAKPNLGLVAQLSKKELNESLSGSFGLEKTDALIALQFSIPLGNKTAKSNISQTDVQISQLQSQIREVVIGLTSIISNLHTQMTEMEKVLRLNVEQINSSREKTDEELKLYNQGRGDLTFVIQSRDNEQNAKLLYAVNALTYHSLLFQYRSLTDQLL